MSHKKIFDDYMAILGEVYDKELTLVLVRGYWRMLQNIPAGTLENAFKRALAECKFFPRPAELLALVVEPDDQRQLSVISQAQIQSTEVMKSILDYKYSADFDETTRKLVGRGARFDINRLRATMLEKDERWFARDFIEAYCNYAKNEYMQALENPGGAVKKLIGQIGQIERAKNE
ncbi:MAG: hypothetical protein GY850_13305 [bacterium]|nr:hypothetical protein [bacterium]